MSAIPVIMLCWIRGETASRTLLFYARAVRTARLRVLGCVFCFHHERVRASRPRVCLVGRNAGTRLAPLLCSILGGLVSVLGVRGLGQVGVSLTGVAFQGGKADDLALVVDGACGLQVQSRVLRDQGIQVGSDSVAPKHGAGAEARANGESQYQAIVADGSGGAVRVTGQGSEIGDMAALPKKCMKAGVAGGVRGS